MKTISPVPREPYFWYISYVWVLPYHWLVQFRISKETRHLYSNPLRFRTVLFYNLQHCQQNIVFISEKKKEEKEDEEEEEEKKKKSKLSDHFLSKRMMQLLTLDPSVTFKTSQGLTKTGWTCKPYNSGYHHAVLEKKSLQAMTRGMKKMYTSATFWIYE